MKNSLLYEDFKKLSENDKKEIINLIRLKNKVNLEEIKLIKKRVRKATDTYYDASCAIFTFHINPRDIDKLLRYIDDLESKVREFENN